MNSKYFKSREFDSPDMPGSGQLVSQELVDLLDLIRGSYGQPIVISSGYRTPQHNLDVGGKPDSEHRTGEAADLVCTDGVTRLRLVQLAIRHGVRRIGVKKDCIHLGVSKTLPQNVMWTYD